ncbi:HAD family hydrolase [Flindersiella endophytica]
MASDSRAYDLIIFDCDGVLVDSERLALKVDVEIYAKLGWPLSEREIGDRYIGRTWDFMLAELEAQLGHAPDPAVLEEWSRRHREVFETELEPVDGIAEALDGITTPACVASSSGHSRLRRTLTKVGLYERFAGRIFSAEDVAHGKPAPDLFLYAAEQLGVEPERCAVVEDSEYGVLAGRSAGMTVYAYTGGDLIPAERLVGERTTLFDDMRKLPGLLST